MTYSPPDVIRSSHNSLIKRVRSLGSRKHRDAERAFVIEGSRGIDTALELGFQPQVVLLAEDATPAILALADRADPHWRVAERGVFDSIMDTATPQGIAAIFDQPVPSFPDVEEPFVVLLDGVGDPGNLGTIVRTAAAAGVDAIVLGPDCADPFGAKAARATMGSIFSMPLIPASGKVGHWVRENCPHRWLADRGGSDHYDDSIWQGGVAVIVGSEGHGPSEWGIDLATGVVSIPLEAGVESLNAAVAAAILIFEGRRQRTRL